MDILITGLWIALLILIPVSILFFAGIAYGRDEDLSTITFKTIICFFFYFLVTIASYSIIQKASAYSADSRHGEWNSTGKIIALAAIYFYGFAGYALSSFVNGSFLNPMQLSFFNSKNPKSIFKK